MRGLERGCKVVRLHNIADWRDQILPCFADVIGARPLSEGVKLFEIGAEINCRDNLASPHFAATERGRLTHTCCAHRALLRNQGTVYDAGEGAGHKKHKPITEQLVLLPLKAASVGIAFGCKKDV